MEVAIGLPNTVPQTTGRQLTAWARAAEESGFSSLGTIDRLVYANYEPLVALAGAAAVTERIRLATTVLLGPLRRSAAVLAKQVLSLDALAGGGRAVLGLGLGARPDDFALSGAALAERGTWIDEALPLIRRIWDGEGTDEAQVGPRPVGAGPSLILGGSVDATFDRVARYADGWIMGGGSPDAFAAGREKAVAAWRGHGREGTPRTQVLSYFALGPDAAAQAQRYLGDYYAFLGEEVAGMIVGSAATSAEAAQGYAEAFAAAGCDELFFIPCSADAEQVRLLAEAVTPLRR